MLPRFLEDRRAGVAPMFALLLVPMVGMVGAAIDYTMALKVRSQLLAAADSASIAAVARSSPALAAAGTMTQDGSIAAGATDARKIFDAQLSLPVKAMLSQVSATVT